METVIRTATVDDAPNWRGFDGTSLMGLASDEVSFDDFQKQFESFLAKALQGRWQAWVAEGGGQLIGNMWLQLVEKVPRPGRRPAHIGYLTNVYIEEGHRGQGLGQQMLEHVVDWCRQESLELILVWPSVEGRSLYQKLGFIPSRKAQDPGEEAMELHLG